MQQTKLLICEDYALEKRKYTLFVCLQQTSGVTRGLNQGWKNIAGTSPLATAGGPLANTQNENLRNDGEPDGCLC